MALGVACSTRPWTSPHSRGQGRLVVGSQLEDPPWAGPLQPPLPRGLEPEHPRLCASHTPGPARSVGLAFSLAGCSLARLVLGAGTPHGIVLISSVRAACDPAPFSVGLVNLPEAPLSVASPKSPPAGLVKCIW